MKESLEKLITRWRKDADQYMNQVEECRLVAEKQLGRSQNGYEAMADYPAQCMLGTATALRQCAADLEKSLDGAGKE